jgi:asparagine synthase (glutamine-hydrolysing)
MCGVCGVFEFSGMAGDRRVEAMTQALAHRGPDGKGFYVAGEIGLGHRRLSIIDLHGGGQPMSNEDSTLQIVFNGEIYNFVELRQELEQFGHIFRSKSDTEVILHAYEQWGPECVTRFNGIFAFGLWDATLRQLMLARDHLGVKPLYFVELGSRILFASEIKALLTDPDCPREVDLEALSQLFTLRYVASPATLFRRIKKLPPGHRMLVNRNGIRVQRYWRSLPELDYKSDESSLVERYQHLVQDAVRLQMRSDVPVGLFLSSGLDSGALLSLMSEHTGHPVRTFTIGFQDGERTNETDHARELAHQFGAEHSEFVIRPQDYECYYNRYLLDLEEPVGNESAAAFYFVSRIASQKVKVVLTGQGADEPWAGYHRHLGIKLSQMYTRLPRRIRDSLLRPLANRFARNERVRRGIQSLGEPDMLSRLIKMYSFYTPEMKSSLFQPWVLRHVSVDGIEARQALSQLHADVDGLDPLTQTLYLDTRTNLPDDLLMVADKTAMANSLEARVPFLDYRIVEFIETLPPHFKIRGLQRKYLHKKALERWLPKSVVYRKKKGFANPIDFWLRSGMRSFVRDFLLGESAAVRQYCNVPYIEHILAIHERKERDYMRHIYLLLSFELWHRQFIGTSLAPKAVGATSSTKLH